MVKSNRLCERKFYQQFCCRTCLMNGWGAKRLQFLPLYSELMPQKETILNGPVQSDLFFKLIVLFIKIGHFKFSGIWEKFKEFSCRFFKVTLNSIWKYSAVNMSWTEHGHISILHSLKCSSLLLSLTCKKKLNWHTYMLYFCFVFLLVFCTKTVQMINHESKSLTVFSLNCILS